MLLEDRTREYLIDCSSLVLHTRILIWIGLYGISFLDENDTFSFNESVHSKILLSVVWQLVSNTYWSTVSGPISIHVDGRAWQQSRLMIVMIVSLWLLEPELSISFRRTWPCSIIAIKMRWNQIRKIRKIKEKMKVGEERDGRKSTPPKINVISPSFSLDPAASMVQSHHSPPTVPEITIFVISWPFSVDTGLGQ